MRVRARVQWHCMHIHTNYWRSILSMMREKKWERKSSWWGLIGSHLWSLHHRHSPFSDKEPINVVNRQKSHLLKWNMSLQWTFLAFNYEIKLEIFVWITRQDILDNEKWISFVTARLWRCRRCCCHFLPFVCHCYCRS